MKKLLLCIVALFSLTLCFGFKSAAYTAPGGGDYKYYYNFTTPETSSTYATTYEIWSDAKFGIVLNSSNYFFCTLLKDSNGNYKVTTFQGDGNYKLPYTQSNAGYDPGTFGNPDYSLLKQPQARLTVRGSTSPLSVGRVLTVSSSNGSYANNAGIATYSSYQNAYQNIYSDYLNSLYDWDNPLYSANIPTPNYEVSYRSLSATPIVDVPLNVNVTNGRETLYIEVKACFELPRRIYVDFDMQNGKYVYSGASRSLAVWEDIIPKEALRASNNTSIDYIHTQLVSAWQDNYNAVTLNDDDWYFSDLVFSGMYPTIKARYENLRKVCCFYGNQMKIMVRYFSIQNDTQFVVGAWRVWENSNPNNFYDELPEYYEPYFPASGSSGTLITVENTPDPETILPPGSGTPTGTYYTPGINISVGQNVPNYPDYPTIRSYNADNFLVQTMNYLDYLNNEESEKTLFGEFGHFLNSLFVFIPGEIWTIIAVGFSLVIVVMFLKIL